MKYVLILLLNLLMIIGVSAQNNPNHVWVKGYTKSNGTYVKGHYRTAPNHTNVDNFSTIGNINPYTYELGYIKPDGQTNPWKEKNEEKKDYVEIEPYYKTVTYSNNISTSMPSTSHLEENATNTTKIKTQNWYSKGDQVNVRFSSETSSTIAFRINKGDLIQVLNKSEHQDFISGYGNDYWYQIEFKNMTGWVFGKLIGRENFDSTSLESWNGKFKIIEGNNVNVRSEPDVSIGKVKFQLDKNQRVEILARTTKKYLVPEYGSHYWYYVKHQDMNGWVFGGLINI